MSYIFFFTNAPVFFFFVSKNAWATLILLCYLWTFSSLDFEPLAEEGLFFLEEDAVCDLLRLLLDSLVLLSSMREYRII